MMIRPRNWKKFQHYTDRKPAWIKLHRDLLDDFEFHRLPVASKALAPLLWLLAAESESALIDADHEKLAFRLRMNPFEVGEALKPLIDAGFFEIAEPSASEVLAKPERNGVSERETETEEETEGEGDARARRVPRGTKTRKKTAAPERTPEDALAEVLNGWREVAGCDADAMLAWLAHWSTKHDGREMPGHQRVSVAKLLADLGDAETQLRAVKTAAAAGWKALRPGDGRAPAKTKAEKAEDARRASERVEWANLLDRAERIGFRSPGVKDDLAGYRCLVERAERDQPRGGSVPIAKLLSSRA
jgi:hypothetical protein